MNNENKRLILIFLIALCLRLILFLAVNSWQDKVLEEKILVKDAEGYHRVAVNLLENNVFSSSKNSPYKPDVTRLPIYPFFLASVYAISGYKPYIAILFQLIFGSLICILIYKIGRTFFNEKIALFTGMIAAFDYSSILYSNYLYADTLFTLLFLVHIYFLAKFIMISNNRWLVSSSAFLGLSALCKTVSIYFFIFLTGVFFLHFMRNLRKGILKYSIFTLFFLLTISPWMVRNYRVSGKFLVSSQQEAVMRWSFPNFFTSLKKSKMVSPQQMERVQNSNHNTSISSISRNDNQEMSKTNIIHTVWSDCKIYTTGMIRFFITPGSSGYPKILGLQSYVIQKQDWSKGLLEIIIIMIQKKSILEWLIICYSISFLFFLYSTMCFGICAAIMKNKFIEVVLFITIIVYFTIASCSFGFTERYRLPIMPFIILLSCYGMIQLQEKLREIIKYCYREVRYR